MAKLRCAGCGKPVGRDWEILVFGGEREGEFVTLKTWEPLHPRCAKDLRHAIDHATQDAGEGVVHFALRGEEGTRVR